MDVILCIALSVSGFLNILQSIAYHDMKRENARLVRRRIIL